MQGIEVGGNTLHYRIEGPEDGPVLVFSNSLGTDLRLWDPLLPYLPAGLRLLRYDKRGHGLSDCPDGPWTIEDHVDDLAGLMDGLRLGSAVVCGLSVGGLIAQGLASRRPELLRALILADTGARIGTPEMWNDRIATIEAGGIEALAEPILERWFTPAFRASAEFPIWRNMLIRTPRAGYTLTAAAIRDADYRQATARLTLPCLAVCGTGDGATPPDLVRQTAALIAGCRFELIEDAGHLPCVERPAVLGRLLTEFLQETGHV